MKLTLPVATLLAASLCAASASARADQEDAPIARLRPAQSAAIPFRPPLVHRGWGPSQQHQFSSSSRLPGTLQPQRGLARDLMFRDEDRDVFQAVHPFLIKPEAPIEVSRLGEPDSQDGAFRVVASADQLR